MESLALRAYKHLPTFLQTAACSAEGWRVKRLRYQPPFDEVLRAYEKRSSLTPSAIQKYRNEKLRAFVEYSYKNFSFYRELFEEHRVTPADIHETSDLKALPVLTKEAIIQGINAGKFDGRPTGRLISIHTSGTTGGGLQFVSTISGIQEQWATWWRYRKLHGLDTSTWCGYFGGRSLVPPEQKKPPFWRTNLFGKQVMFSAYHMNLENISHYLTEIRKRKLPWLHGYPSSLTLLASHAIETNFKLGYQLRSITTGAENLTDHQKFMIESAFGIKPVQHYGMAEGVANISECKQGHLHVDEDFAATEFVDNQGTGTKQIVGTNFTNYAFPLINYSVGDNATLSDIDCSCGNPGRVVQSIDGRHEDYLVLQNGAKVGRLDHILKDMIRIREAQFIQTKKGSATLRIVKRADFSEQDLLQLKSEITARIGSQCEVSIEPVEKIERTKSGKLRFVISSVN